MCGVCVGWVGVGGRLPPMAPCGGGIEPSAPRTARDGRLRDRCQRPGPKIPGPQIRQHGARFCALPAFDGRRCARCMLRRRPPPSGALLSPTPTFLLFFINNTNPHYIVRLTPSPTTLLAPPLLATRPRLLAPRNAPQTWHALRRCNGGWRFQPAAGRGRTHQTELACADSVDPRRGRQRRVVCWHGRIHDYDRPCEHPLR